MTNDYAIKCYIVIFLSYSSRFSPYFVLLCFALIIVFEKTTALNQVCVCVCLFFLFKALVPV